MSVEIVSRTISSILDKKVALANGMIGALIDWSTLGWASESDWQELWIGARLAFTDPGVNLTGTPRFYLGMMSSPASAMSNGPLGSSTSHFVGLSQSQATLTYNAGPPVRFTGGNVEACKKVGTTITQFVQATSFYSADPEVRLGYIFRILKGSPNYTVSRVAKSANTTGLADVSLAGLVNALEAGDIAAATTALNNDVGAAGYAAATSTTAAVDEGTDGTLNAVCFAWERTVAVQEGSEILIVKKA